MTTLFVTGTDTGAGKTFVSATLAAGLRARGVHLDVAKPAETGCVRVGGVLVPEDAATLAAAAESTTPIDVVCPHRFPDPLAPLLAAERAGAAIDVAALADGLRVRAARVATLLVEGAGGLLVPLTRTASFADLAARLDATVVLVVGSRLGAINHALLTLAALRARGLVTAGYVVNDLIPAGDLAVDTNAALLASLTNAPCLGRLPYLDDAAAVLAALRTGGAPAAAARTRLAALAATHLDLAALAG